MANIIYGTDGNDTLGYNRSTYSIDSIVGGLGNDLYFVDNYKDIVVEGLDGGNDTIVIENDYAISKASYTLAKNVENLDLRYYNIPAYFESIVNNPSYGYSQSACDKDLANLKIHRNVVNANASDNVIILHDPRAPIDLNNTNFTGSYIKIFAGAGNDVVSGGAGDDYFDGGSGDDILYGDSGTNTLIGGTGDDTLVGGTGINTLSGGAGNDLLYGGSGTSFLNGGVGNDTYFINGTETSMKIIDAGGKDTLALDSATGTFLASGASIANFATVENIDASLITSGTSSLTLTGNNLANNIYGSEGTDTINTGAGNDAIYGGNDTSVDYLCGGAGNDTYGIQDKNDVIYDVEGFNTLSLGDSFTGGVDLTVEYTSANILTLDGTWASGNLALSGNSFNNTITSNTGNDSLNGGLGADLMVGSDGDDTYYVDNLKDRVIEKTGEGDDTVYLTSAISYTLANNVENLNLTAISLGSYSKKLGLTVKGNTLDNTIIASNTAGAYMKILAGAGNDTILGGASADYIDGGIGDDSIQGGNGDNTIFGGEGNNYISANDGNNTITAGAGNDTIQVGNGNNIINAGNGNNLITTTSGNSTLSASIGNNKITTGTGDDFIVSNGYNDTIISGAGNDNVFGEFGNDFIDGGAGNDSIWGNLGNDTLTGGAGNDIFNFTSGDGKDIITATDKGDIISIAPYYKVSTTDLLFYKDKAGDFCIDYTEDRLGAGVGVDVITIAKGKFDKNTTVQIGGYTIHINDIISQLSKAGTSLDVAGTGIDLKTQHDQVNILSWASSASPPTPVPTT